MIYKDFQLLRYNLNVFKKRVTNTQNIAFIGIIAALNVVTITLATLFNFVAPFVIILLPFLSASVCLTCKYRFYPIYAVATVLVSYALTFYNHTMTLYYLVPALFTGFIFGFFINKRLDSSISLIVSSIIQTALSIAFIYLTNFIYNIDLINNILKILKLDTRENIYVIVLGFIFLFSYIQCVLSYIILSNEINKFDIKIEENFTNIIVLCSGLFFSLLTLIFSFFKLDFSYLFLFIGIIISVSYLVNNFNTKYLFHSIFELVIYSIGFILTLFLFNIVKMPYSFLLINISNILLLLEGLIYNLIRKNDGTVL